MKILYILPHCSTGGMPQYVVKQVEEFVQGNEVRIIEVNNYSDEYVVQRNKLKALCSLRQLSGKTELLPRIINEIAPDVVHFQEVPEKYLPVTVLRKIYDHNRKYFIVVTSHSSLTRRSDFMFIPDRIVAVNNWQKELFSKELPETQIDIWEYPIESKKPTQEEKEIARQELEHFSFSEQYKGKHILNIGLFTSGKNQAELFEIARKDPENHYHFVGNQAENFRSYWEPLMKNKPTNCYVWGEREDVERFYKACDEFYFTSLFELNPLVIKEALSFGLPVKMRKLPTYGTDYDNNPLVTYI